MGWRMIVVLTTTVGITLGFAAVPDVEGQTSEGQTSEEKASQEKASEEKSTEGEVPKLSFDAELVVAKVNKRDLTLGELMVRFATLSPFVRSSYGGDLEKFLSDTVGNLLVSERAESLEVHEDPLFNVLLSIRREELLRDFYARRTVLAEIDEATLERRYLEQLPTRFQRQEHLRLRQILIMPSAEANAPSSRRQEELEGRETARHKAENLRRMISAGDVGFARVAQEQSDDASAPEGGDLGWMASQELMPSLRKASSSLRVGELSEVVESALGFHLLEVLDRRPGGDVSLALVRELLYQEIVGEQAAHYSQSATEDRQRLISEAAIELFPERLPW